MYFNENRLVKLVRYGSKAFNIHFKNVGVLSFEKFKTTFTNILV